MFPTLNLKKKHLKHCFLSLKEKHSPHSFPTKFHYANPGKDSPALRGRTQVLAFPVFSMPQSLVLQLVGHGPQQQTSIKTRENNFPHICIFM